MERVEQELAGEAEQIEGTRPVFGDEATGGGEVLAGHDLLGLDRLVLVGGVALAEPVERPVDVAQLLDRVPGLAQLAAAGVTQRLDALTDARVGVVAQPRRWLHDVCVGVVHDEPRRVVGHRPMLPSG